MSPAEQEIRVLSIAVVVCVRVYKPFGDTSTIRFELLYLDVGGSTVFRLFLRTPFPAHVSSYMYM